MKTNLKNIVVVVAIAILTGSSALTVPASAHTCDLHTVIDGTSNRTIFIPPSGDGTECGLDDLGPNDGIGDGRPIKEQGHWIVVWVPQSPKGPNPDDDPRIDPRIRTITE